MPDGARAGMGGAMDGTRRGRWIWGASAVATAAAFIAFFAAGVTTSVHVRKGLVYGPGAQWLSTSVQTVTFRQPVNAIDVHDYGAPVEVSADRAAVAEVTETMRYNGARPAVENSVANGRLTLADPACAGGRCSIALQVTVPAGTTARLESDGGAIHVTGLSGPVAADSGGGPVTARGVSAGLNARTGGGALSVRDESGPLTADTSGGPADAAGLAATDVSIATGGGAATLAFTAVPQRVQADSGGGPVTVGVPGGRYAVRADSGGGPQQIGVATDPASPDTISVSSGGGALFIR